MYKLSVVVALLSGINAFIRNSKRYPHVNVIVIFFLLFHTSIRQVSEIEEPSVNTYTTKFPGPI